MPEMYKAERNLSNTRKATGTGYIAGTQALDRKEHASDESETLLGL